jgi:hypothetical protein
MTTTRRASCLFRVIDKMRIKKTSTNNEYLRAGDVWVRNFTNSAIPLSISSLHDADDYKLVISNEEVNRNRPRIADEKLAFQNVLIISDGFNFASKHLLIEKMPPEVCILAINGALKDWKISPRRNINAYVVNNPYAECLKFLPLRSNKYYPSCIASIRTHAAFLRQYLGDSYLYCPTPERIFGVNRAEKYYIDDYRNPVCAAIGLAFQFGVRKLMLMSCDESFDRARDSAIQLPNKLWTYPQHLRSEAIIDANLHWLTHQEHVEVKVANYSDGGNYENAAYISSEQEALDYFVETTDE